MLWKCFLAAGPGSLVKATEKMNAAEYRKILEENLMQSARELQIGRRFVSQQDNDHKHTSKAIHKWLMAEPEQTSIQLMDLWVDLKQVHIHKPHATLQTFGSFEKKNEEKPQHSYIQI